MRGDATPGYAELSASTGPLPDFTRVSVLHLGSIDQPLVAALDIDSDHVVEVDVEDAVALQLERRFDLVIVGTDALTSGDEGSRRATLHGAMQHIERSGHLIVHDDLTQPTFGPGRWADDLHVVGSFRMCGAMLSLYRRGERTTVHDLLFEARATITRVLPRELAERLQQADGTLVLDTRTHTDRQRFGVIPGSIHVPRTVVEWHFDPANGYLHPAMQSFGQPLVLLCNGGYSSSLAAANLVRMGFTDVADLIGGYTAWAAERLPMAQPDHSHLDTLSVGES